MATTAVRWSIVILFAFLLASDWVLGIEREYTISLDPGKTTCFYEIVKHNEIIDIEYQVFTNTNHS